jgi:hypothetical protein
MNESKALYDVCRVCNKANYDVLKEYLAEHPEVKVDLYRDGNGWTAMLMAARRQSHRSIALLSEQDKYIALLVIERAADIHLKNKWNQDALAYCVRQFRYSIAFTLLCCGCNYRELNIDRYVTQARVNACIAEYKQTHAFIEAYHESLTHTLANEVKVDTRLARTSLGIYHEPLERVLEYLGLSMHKNQTVNTSIDGQGEEDGGVKRVLIPDQARNAKHWYDLSKQ